MDNLEPITREETLLDGGDLTPITRKEMFIKRIYDKTQSVPEPITREEYFLAKAGEGSGGDVTIEQLNVTENGTYSESDKAYSPVVVNVPTPPIPENAYLLNNLSGLPAEIASFNDGTDLPMASLKVTVTPYQDLHGYDAPWAGGAGKNKCDTHGYDGIAYNRDVGTEVTFTDSTIPVTVNGNKITYSVASWGGVVFKTPSLPSGTYHFHAEFSSTVNRRTIYVLNSNNVVKEAANYSDSGGILDLNRTLEDGDCIAIWIGSNSAGDITITNIQVESGSSYTTWQPYSNICPIIGWDEAVVTVADDAESPTTSHEYTIDLDGTRYGGVVDVANGTMDDTLDYIASYNGETLPSTWISDRDVYAESTTPTIGAEVVYTRATPITVQLTPTQVKSLEGENNISANCGQITEVKYFKKA